jgi:DNA polymerase-3 subunit epsilon
MEFAIVDIETTGGYAAANGITEISIQVHDGHKVIKRYETLVNPGMPIPHFITSLTGITNEMVRNAPSFEEIAPVVYGLLESRIFVAHAVNFDYSFIKTALAQCNFSLTSKKLCTVRLSRKIFPGYQSYSLGKLCSQLGITINNRHRAGGDADATVVLFEKLLHADSDTLFKFLKRGSKEQALPPHLPKEQFEKLPETPGIYYFRNNKGKVIYVGKAINIRKRVLSHFSGNSPQKQKQDFIKHIHSVSHYECGNELMSLILESHEIKQLWPEFNRSQKRFEPAYGLVAYTDQRGFNRLAIEKMRKQGQCLTKFSYLAEGYSFLHGYINQYELCPRLCGLAKSEAGCENPACACHSPHEQKIKAYNQRLAEALCTLNVTESYAIIEAGRTENEAGCIVVENGAFKKMGFISREHLSNSGINYGVLEHLPLYRENFNIRQMIENYCYNNPENKYQIIKQTEAVAL